MAHRQFPRLLLVWLSGALLVPGSWAGATPTGQDALPASVLAALQTAELPVEALAGVALPLGDTRRRPWAFQAQRAMQPGSTMKLVTSVVALDRLGPALRGHTELRSAALLDPEGLLQGDLVLKGGGDPDLGVAQLWDLLAELRQSGVHTIAGDLIIDRSLWRPARPDLGVPPFDDAPEFGYNVIPDALQLAQGLLSLRLSSVSGTLQAVTVPPLPGLRVDALGMQLNDKRCNEWASEWLPAQVRREGEETVVELRGGFPKACTRRVNLQLLDRTELTERLFSALWQQLGGRWSGRAREDVAPEGSRLLVSRQSRPWAEVLRPLNKTSDNALTRMLFMALGVPLMAVQPQATTAELATQVVLDWMRENGIDPAGLVLDNGSGLSRSERLTPLQLAQLLKVAHGSRYAADLIMSLPQVGVDGTMRNRIKDSPATGWARLKTGTLRNVAALAGYMNDPKGQPWAVVLIINHDNAARGRAALDAWVDDFSRQGPAMARPMRGKRPAATRPGLVRKR